MPEAPESYSSSVLNFSVNVTHWWVRSSTQMPTEGMRAGRWRVQKLSLEQKTPLFLWQVNSESSVRPFTHPLIKSFRSPSGVSRCLSESQTVSPSKGTVNEEHTERSLMIEVDKTAQLKTKWSMDLTNRVSAIGKYNEGDNARGIARAWMSSWGDITSVCSFLGMKAKIMTQGSARL